MKDDPGSLANLRDIVSPALPSFWPPAPGAVIVGACILAAIAIWCVQMLQAYRRNAYRRVAGMEIDRICRSASVGDEKSVAISEVLKRAALVAYPRETVASLSGSGWTSFLEKTGEFGSSWPGELDDVAQRARLWLRTHRYTSPGV